MKKFDLVSDIHIDFWINFQKSHAKVEKNLNVFIQSILPEKPSDTLVIAGDVANSNYPTKKFLKEIKKYYKYILLVFGNHDLYLDSKSQKRKYKMNSMNRFYEMNDFAKEMNNVYYLDGEIIEVDGIKFGGTAGWYDFSFGTNVLEVDMDAVINKWHEKSNDSICLKGLPYITKEMAKIEKEKLNNIIEDSEVIITHVPPDYSNFKEEYKSEIETSFYVFDGSEYFEKIQNKIWCFGHTHNNCDYKKYDCRFINQSIGYPGKSEKAKIKTIYI